MLDRTIPFCNTIMKCSDYEYRNVELPDGFSVVSYQSGYEKEWAKLEYAIGDFDSVTEAVSSKHICRIPNCSRTYFLH